MPQPEPTRVCVPLSPPPVVTLSSGQGLVTPGDSAVYRVQLSSVAECPTTLRWLLTTPDCYSLSPNGPFTDVIPAGYVTGTMTVLVHPTARFPQEGTLSLRLGSGAHYVVGNPEGVEMDIKDPRPVPDRPPEVVAELVTPCRS